MVWGDFVMMGVGALVVGGLCFSLIWIVLKGINSGQWPVK